MLSTIFAKIRLSEVLSVGIGGFLGVICRHMLSVTVRVIWPDNRFPIATFVVNMLGCLLIGWVVGLFDSKYAGSDTLRLVLIVGFLGGFTTFSSFALESLQLIKSGQIALAMFNVGIKVVLGMILVAVGFSLSKLL